MSVQAPGANLFQEELREHLAELDSALLDLDREPGSSEAVNRIFRALHTVKGSCDMFGLANAVAMLHDIESLWDQVRKGQACPNRELSDITFQVKDRMDPVAESGQDPEPDLPLAEAMAALADKVIAPPGTDCGGAQPDPGPAPAQGFPQEAGGQARTRTYRVRLAPSDPGHLDKSEPAALLEALAELGPVRVNLDASDVPPLDELDPGDCRLRWEATLTTDKDADAVRDVFLFMDNPRDATVEEFAGDPGGEPAPGPAPAAPAAPSGRPTPAPEPAARPAAQPQAAKPKAPAQSVRVETTKLDNLVNLVGELVIAQARLTQVASGLSSSELTGVAEEMERLVVELRDNTLGIRMLPIGTTFSRFRRLVRDLSAELGKEIDLSAEGGETELDKTVIEQLGDPMVHLLRNSIDHGIEKPGDRLAAGKPQRGLIRLTARQSSGTVVIRIEDDGKGLDPARIRAVAVERGVIPPDAKLTNQEIQQLIFAPGFSTASQVTSVSGRGVGMDVVKRSIEALRGTVEIDSAPGQGAAITITLPLTLAIIDGLQVRVAGELYIIPLALVEECVELARPAGTQRRNRTLSVRGEIVPYLRLRETFRLEGDPPALEQVVVTRHENGRTGIAVDEVIGQQQTVIKNLGRLIGRIEGISGATINGDGSMALILDVSQLVQGVLKEAEE